MCFGVPMQKAGRGQICPIAAAPQEQLAPILGPLSFIRCDVNECDVLTTERAAVHTLAAGPMHSAGLPAQRPSAHRNGLGSSHRVR